jgi:predicted metal-dependent RNase
VSEQKNNPVIRELLATDTPYGKPSTKIGKHRSTSREQQEQAKYAWDIFYKHAMNAMKSEGYRARSKEERSEILKRYSRQAHDAARRYMERKYGWK